MSNCFLADNNGVPWAVIGDGFDTDTVTAQGLSSRQTRRTRSGDFPWPPAGTSTGHQWGLSHGHGQTATPAASCANWTPRSPVARRPELAAHPRDEARHRRITIMAGPIDSSADTSAFERALPVGAQAGSRCRDGRL